MPINQRDLRELLDERSRPASERPVPWPELRARLRGSRRRRLTAAALTATAGAAAVAVAVTVLPAGNVVTAPDRSNDTRVLAAPSGPFQPQIVESDGTVYRRLATAMLDPLSKKPTSVDVELSGKPLAVLWDCPGGLAAQYNFPLVTAEVPGASVPIGLSPNGTLTGTCQDGRPIDMQPLPAGARRATLTFAAGAADPATRPRKLPVWRFGVYEWTPPGPGEAVPPSPLTPAPIEGRTVVGTTRGTWPATQELKITVPAKGRNFTFITYCGKHLARRIAGDLRINGRLINAPVTVTCFDPSLQARGHRIFTMLGDADSRGRKTITISVRLRTHISHYRQRPGALSLVVYKDRG
ncbi:hypothetical protein SAMN05421505_12734 [Sinosporangium album]|uniref:Uncharacterized protein n=1 Tax=Sinosporangium album TaxID=504805 RepID=A0A1G8GGI8_9ACTN|nr:hypothetical protein [Sinosporangium album]SDH93503.1 hypothetical protein SAMN05421505_12734 [Sinosporangium album]